MTCGCVGPLKRRRGSLGSEGLWRQKATGKGEDKRNRWGGGPPAALGEAGGWRLGWIRPRGAVVFERENKAVMGEVVPRRKRPNHAEATQGVFK